MTTRRKFMSAAAASIAALAAPIRALAQADSPFRISVITDEVSNDFDHACSIAANDFGMHWVEIRALWGKNVADLSSTDVGMAQSVLGKYNLRVTDIASPLFKVDWPGAPRSRFSSVQNFATAGFDKQDEVLYRCIQLAKDFNTDKIRCFDFWRLEDPAPFRDAMDQKLRDAVKIASDHGITLILENEQDCNTATAQEAVRLLAAVPGLYLNWDPANAVMHGELDAFPAGWDLLPKDRIHHCHCKNVVSGPGGKRSWSPVGTGLVDWPAQFRALKQIGYHGAVSLETHWRGAGTPEASSRVSWAGMKQALSEAGAI